MEVGKSPAASTTALETSNIIEPNTNVTTTSTLTQTSNLVTSSTSLPTATSQNIAHGLLPLPVGREFVRQYYTVMGKSPKKLYRFYSPKSTLTFGNNPILIGQDKIRKDIERRELRNCHAYIIKIDSQPTLGNGIVVQVIGELSNNDEPSRPFTQTFVLSLHIPKNFYIHNEIFRYQDELYPEINLKALKLTTPQNQHGTETTESDKATSSCLSDSWIPSPSKPSVEMNTKMTTVVFVADKTQSKSSSSSIGTQSDPKIDNNSAHEVVSIEKLTESLTCKPEISQESIIAVRNDNEISLATVSPIQKSKDLLQDTHSSMEADKKPKEEGPETPSNTPMTYANVFKSASGLLNQESNSELTNSVKIKPIFIRSAIFTSSTSPFVPVMSSNKSCADSKSTVLGTKPTTKDRTIHSPQRFTFCLKTVGSKESNAVRSASFHQHRRARQRQERYDESLQIFIGNIPNCATTDAVAKIFERYGTILELRVLSKSAQPGMRKLPKYGFLTFDTPEAVQRCLGDVPFYFPGNTRNAVRLNVRQKNRDEDQPVRVINSPSNISTTLKRNGKIGCIPEWRQTEKRLGRRERNMNFLEHDRNIRMIIENKEIVEDSYSTKLMKHEKPNSLPMEDWPPICGISTESGGGSSENIRRKKDFKYVVVKNF